MTKPSSRAALISVMALSMELASIGWAAHSEALPQPASAPGCEAFNAPIQALDGHDVPHSRVESCPGGVTDITPEPNNLPAGEMTVLSMGRFLNKQVPFLFRGVPNTAYPFRPVYLHDLAGRFLFDRAPHPLTGLAHALPFQPKQVLSLGDLGDGHTGYGYTDLEILPSHAHDAEPLNRQSVIIAIDGYNFVSYNALPSYLAQAAAQERTNPYVEVTYVQIDDKTQTFHRAFIPIYTRKSVEPEWSKIAATNPAFKTNPANGKMQEAVLFGLVGLLAANALGGDSSDSGHDVHCVSVAQGSYSDGGTRYVPKCD